MQFKTFKKSKLPFYFALSSLFVLASCGSYQYVGQDNDGIYGSSDTDIVIEETAPKSSDNGYYKEYFAVKSQKYADLAQDDNVIFTDIDDYEGNYSDDNGSVEYTEGYAGWGQDHDNVTINVYSNFGFNPWYRPYGYGWGYYGNYDPFYVYSPFGFGFYGGYYSPFYNNYYSPYYGYGYYNWNHHHGYGNYNRYYNRNYAYSQGRRSSTNNGYYGRNSSPSKRYDTNSRNTVNRRSTVSRNYNERSTFRRSSNGTIYKTPSRNIRSSGTRVNTPSKSNRSSNGARVNSPTRTRSNNNARVNAPSRSSNNSPSVRSSSSSSRSSSSGSSSRSSGGSSRRGGK